MQSGNQRSRISVRLIRNRAFYACLKADAASCWRPFSNATEACSPAYCRWVTANCPLYIKSQYIIDYLGRIRHHWFTPKNNEFWFVLRPSYPECALHKRGPKKDQNTKRDPANRWYTTVCGILAIIPTLFHSGFSYVLFMLAYILKTGHFPYIFLCVLYSIQARVAKSVAKTDFQKCPNPQTVDFTWFFGTSQPRGFIPTLLLQKKGAENQWQTERASKSRAFRLPLIIKEYRKKRDWRWCK